VLDCVACFPTILCAFQIIFVIIYASITVLFFDNSLLTIPGRPQLATELLQSFLYKIQSHFALLARPCDHRTIDESGIQLCLSTHDLFCMLI
jgi:hypothetical protein